MANPDHLARLSGDVTAWNDWRTQNPFEQPDLRGADLRGADLSWADLYRADLGGADLQEAKLHGARLGEAWATEVNLRFADLQRASLRGAHASNADLRNADLRRADLCNAALLGADLRGADLREAWMEEVDLSPADLSDADLSRASLNGASMSMAKLRNAQLVGSVLAVADLFGADLGGANLSTADLTGAELSEANLNQADLCEANLTRSTLVETDLSDAVMNRARVYGVSVWNTRGAPRVQTDLIITPDDEADITVDDLKVAQFIYLLLANPQIREVIDTVARKAVLILGRFTPERKPILDALRGTLREHNYAPILFDFERPASRDLTETVRILAHLARFIIADLTDPASIPQELQAIVPDLAVPVVPILCGDEPWVMFGDLRRRYHWVLDIQRYEDQAQLLDSLEDRVIAPAEAKATELSG